MKESMSKDEIRNGILNGQTAKWLISKGAKSTSVKRIRKALIKEDYKINNVS